MSKNPPGDFAGRLVEAAGMKGAKVGQAEISSRHANFFLNQGGASAADVARLLMEARRRGEGAGGGGAASAWSWRSSCWASGRPICGRRWHERLGCHRHGERGVSMEPVDARNPCRRPG